MSTVDEQAPAAQGDWYDDRHPPVAPPLPPWAFTFLNSLRKCGSVRYAAAAAKVTVRTVKRLKARRPDFKAQADAARQHAVGILERAAYRRAVQGIDEVTTVVRTDRSGDVVATETKTRRVFSDTTLLKLLQANDPRKYASQSRVDTTIHDDRAISRDALQAALRDPESRELLARLAERQALLAGSGAPKHCTVQCPTVVEVQPTHAQLAETTMCGKNPVLGEPFGGDEAGVEAQHGNQADEAGAAGLATPTQPLVDAGGGTAQP